VTVDGDELPALRQGFTPIARAYNERYGVPVMLAETNTVSELATGWLRETWNDSVELLESGIPVAGYCWYSLTDQVDWDSCLTKANDTVNSFGLVDLDRRRRPVASLYERLARATLAHGIPAMTTEDEEAAA
jgi:beta-glucosidase/6-phospho-beta-glucosidase/beta-galactosidase